MLAIRPAAAILVGALSTVMVGGSAAGMLPHGAVAGSAFRVAASLHYGPASNASGFSAVVVTGRTAWLFGGTDPGGPSAPVAASWNGRRVVPSKLPAGLSGFISDASAPAAGDVWAASQYGGYVLHWDGRRWFVSARWRHGEITGLVAIDPGDVWVFGPAADQGVGTWHFNGRSWQRAGGYATGIYRASAVSRDSIWAIATGGQSEFVLRFDGRRWRRIGTGRVLRGLQAHDILAISNRNVWIVGDVLSRSGAAQLVLVHWNGTTWTRLDTGLDVWAGRLARGWRGSVLITATPAGASATGLIIESSAQAVRSVFVLTAGQGSGVSDVALTRDGRSLLASGGILAGPGGDAALWTGRPGRVRRHPDDGG